MRPTTLRRSAALVALAFALGPACAEGGSSSLARGDEKPATSPVMASSATAGPAVAKLSEEECQDACVNLIRITMSELGEIAFRLPPDALSRPRTDCLSACRAASNAQDLAKMRCLVASHATTTGELTSECGIDLREHAPTSTTTR